MKRLRVRKLEREDIKAVIPELHALVGNSLNGLAVTAVDAETDEIVFIGGMQKIFEKTGEAWFQFAPGAEGYIAVPRTARKILYDLIVEMNLDRVQATADVRRPELPGWLDFMGFEYECTLRKYGHEGQDVDMYVMFPGEV
jgi:hypothetical protein